MSRHPGASAPEFVFFVVFPGICVGCPDTPCSRPLSSAGAWRAAASLVLVPARLGLGRRDGLEQPTMASALIAGPQAGDTAPILFLSSTVWSAA